MKIPVLLSCALVATLAISCSTTPTTSKAKPVRLFNGKDLSNWTAVLAKPGVTKEEVWSVRDGTILCQGDPLGYIRTDESFTNFKLELDYRWTPGTKPGNSGVFLRINGQPRPLPRCIECQLKNGDAGDLYGFHGMGIDGEPARRKEVKNHELGGDFVGVKKMSGSEKPAGEWNRVEILAEGPRVTVRVNGHKVNEASGCEAVAGPIGLQSEGGQIEFRDVRLVPLAP